MIKLPRLPEPLSPFEEELLKGSWFMPFSDTGFNIDLLVKNYDASVEQIQAAIERFETEGLVRCHDIPGMPARCDATEKGWLTREALLLARSLRHPALRNQREYEPHDLILAFACAPFIHNQREQGSFLGEMEEVALDEMRVYLHDYDDNELNEAVLRLADRGDVTRCTKQRGLDRQPAIMATGAGRKRYFDEVAPQLGIYHGRSIRDWETQESLDVFWAWQSEYKKSRNVFKDALETVIDRINRDHKLVPPLRLIEAREPGEGAIRIDVEIQNKIRRAEFFVGDFTAVYQYEGRLRVNENVLVEVGYALASKEPSQVLLLALQRNDVPGPETDVVNRAFDIAHVHRLEFDTNQKPADVRNRIRAELEAALRRRKRLR